jgi:hypothetical protein
MKSFLFVLFLRFLSVLAIFCGFAGRGFDRMIIKGTNGESDILGNILDFASVISDNTDLEKLKIFAMGLEGSHVSFHHIVHSVCVFSGLKFGFRKVLLNNISSVVRCMVEVEFEDGLVFFRHFACDIQFLFSFVLI